MAKNKKAKKIKSSRRAAAKKDRRGFLDSITRFLNKHKKLSIFAGVILLIALSAGIKILFLSAAELPAEPPKMEEKVEVIVAPPEPTTFPSPLTGVEVSKEQSERPLTAFIIENSPDARPQSGLNEAGIVFEAIAEGGITRFGVVYQENAPTEVGPVRSVRPYFLDWLKPYGATMGHVGGSRSGLSIVRDGSWRDMDQFSYSKTYWRSNKRKAPHNVYTSFERVDAFNKNKDYSLQDFAGWPRKADGPVPAAETRVGQIKLNISSASYNSIFTFDESSNSYVRAEGGKPHLDVSGTQLNAKVVVAMISPYSVVNEIDGARLRYKTSGSGQAFVFQDGSVQEVTWNKTGASGKLTFTDVNGAELVFNKGKVWITALSTRGRAVW